MTDKQSADVAGKTLIEADPALFEETRSSLENSVELPGPSEGEGATTRSGFV